MLPFKLEQKIKEFFEQEALTGYTNYNIQVRLTYNYVEINEIPLDYEVVHIDALKEEIAALKEEIEDNIVYI